jgi:hypothetical protein
MRRLLGWRTVIQQNLGNVQPSKMCSDTCDAESPKPMAKRFESLADYGPATLYILMEVARRILECAVFVPPQQPAEPFTRAKGARRIGHVLCPPTPDYRVKELQSMTPTAISTSTARRIACPLTVQYRFLVVPCNDFERHPRLVSCLNSDPSWAHNLMLPGIPWSSLGILTVVGSICKLGVRRSNAPEDHSSKSVKPTSRERYGNTEPSPRSWGKA